MSEIPDTMEGEDWLSFKSEIPDMASSLKHPRNIVGLTVARHRHRLNWSQTQLAVRCQVFGWPVSRSIIAAIEGRVRWVGDFEVLILAKVLRVRPADLLPDKIDWEKLKLPAF